MIDATVNIDSLFKPNIERYGFIDNHTMYGFKNIGNGLRLVTIDSKSGVQCELFDLFNTENGFDRTSTSAVVRVNQNKRKIAMGMLFLNQINIIDLDNPLEKSISVSIGKVPTDEPSLQKIDPFTRKIYYNQINITDKYIFGAYNGSKEHDKCQTIHVFDWDGNFVATLNTDKNFRYFTLDEKDKYIYLYGVKENCYKAQLNELL